jgi:predicted permease
MLDIYYVTAQKILVMLIFITIGFILRRKKILPEQSGKTLSVLLTNLFLPAMIFNNLSKNLHMDTITKHFTSLVIGVGFLVAVIVIAKLFASLFSNDRETKNTFTYIFAFSNYAYFGYPVIENVFGSKMLANTIIFAIPFTITIFTYGVHLLIGSKTPKKMEFKEILFSLLKPVLIAVFWGVLCGLLSVKIPKVISNVVTMSASCMSPVSMILTGFVIAALPLKDLFKSKKAYVVSIIRLVIIPVIFVVGLWLVGLRGENYIIPVVISAMPVGMNVVVFTEANGKDSKYSACICFISYIISLITIPIIFGFLCNIAT